MRFVIAKSKKAADKYIIMSYDLHRVADDWVETVDKVSCTNWDEVKNIVEFWADNFGMGEMLMHTDNYEIAEQMLDNSIGSIYEAIKSGETIEVNW